MSIVTGRAAVLGVYAEAASRRWTLPCFCTENLTTTEAILAATSERGAAIGLPDAPIIVAITCRYSHRGQAALYTHTRRWEVGLALFLSDLRVLAGPGGPYEGLRVLVHLDHAQFDDDAGLLAGDLSGFSSVMFDASKASFEENMGLTARFVRERGAELVVEGACDEIVDASGAERSEITNADRASAYFDRTGVDLIVANLGTEHRASAGTLSYRGDMARQIKARVGERIVLHGASSVPPEQVASLREDGVCKVNIWTALERDSSPALLRDMAANAGKVAGAREAKALAEEGVLGPAADARGPASLDFFTTTHRQQVVFREMKRIVGSYLELWYRA